MAPLPKGDGQRVRRNLGQRQWTTLRRGVVKVPAMPGSTDLDADVRKVARAYWKALWTDLGEIYADSDRYPLARLCALHARVQLGKRVGAQLQAELRQLEQAYGGSPLGRQRLMVKVEPLELILVSVADPAQVADIEAHRARQADRRARIEQQPGDA